jgi:hypothetical protein
MIPRGSQKKSDAPAEAVFAYMAIVTLIGILVNLGVMH